MMNSFLKFLINIVIRILPGSHLFSMKRMLLRTVGFRIDNEVSVNHGVIFYGNGTVSIGAKTWIGPRCIFYTHEEILISIGKNCDIAPEVAFVPGSHEIGNFQRRAGTGKVKEIIVGDGCWIGTRSVILGGVTIGNGSVVAAGAVVTKNVPENSLVGGVPAKVLRFFE